MFWDILQEKRNYLLIQLVIINDLNLLIGYIRLGLRFLLMKTSFKAQNRESTYIDLFEYIMFFK